MKKIISLLSIFIIFSLSLNAKTLNQLETDSVNKPIMVVITMDNCKYCKKQKKSMKGDKELLNLINSKFQFLELNRSRVPVPSKLANRGAPTTFILSPSGKVLKKLEGFRKAPELKRALKEVL